MHEVQNCDEMYQHFCQQIKNEMHIFWREYYTTASYGLNYNYNQEYGFLNHD